MNAHRRVSSAIAAAVLLALSACTPSGPKAYEVFDENGASMGTVALDPSCSSEADTLVRRGLAMLHNMTYEKAEADFSAAAGLDAECVLARWGQAVALFHPLWPDVPSPETLQRGRDLLAGARALTATEHEAAYLGALEAYFIDGESRTEAERLARYEAAWRGVAEAYPEDS